MTFRQVVLQQLSNFELVLFPPGTERDMEDIESPREVWHCCFHSYAFFYLYVCIALPRNGVYTFKITTLIDQDNGQHCTQNFLKEKK